MKSFFLSLFLLLTVNFASAQFNDDVYYNFTLVTVTNNNYESPDYDYYYTSRIRRFNRCYTNYNFGYYSPYFIDTYWYDPTTPTYNIYVTYNQPYLIWNWRRWNYWCYSPWYTNNYNWNYNNWNFNNNWYWYNQAPTNNWIPEYDADDYFYGPRRPTTGIQNQTPVINRTYTPQTTPIDRKPVADDYRFTDRNTPTRTTPNPVVRETPRTIQPNRYETPRYPRTETPSVTTTPRNIPSTRVETPRVSPQPKPTPPSRNLPPSRPSSPSPRIN